MRILRLDVLNCLSMGAVDIHADDGFVEVWVGRLNDGVVDVVEVVEGVKAFENELEQRFKIVWMRRSDENIAVSMGYGGCYRDAQRCRLAATTSSGKSHCVL